MKIKTRKEKIAESSHPVTTGALFHLKDLIDELQNTSSRNEKDEILLEFLEHRTYGEMVCKFLYMTYHPLMCFYLTSDLANRTALHFNPSSFVDLPFWAILLKFSKREIAGHKACAFWVTCLEKLPEELRPVANAMLDKDLNSGIGLKSINKAFRKLERKEIPEFSVARGEPWIGQEVWKWEDDWYASRKLDGIRCVVIHTPGIGVSLFSREGRRFESLGVLEEALSDFHNYLGEGFVLDGEVSLRTATGSDDFQGIMKEIRKKNHTIKDPKLHVFDFLSYDVFFGNKPCKDNLRKRWDRFAELIRRSNITLPECVTFVKQYEVETGESFQRLLDKSRKERWEGLILRKDALYRGKRSADIFKVKDMMEDEFKVVDILTGPFTVQHEGKTRVIRTMTAAVISYKGNTVNVGSGWPIALRKKFFKKPELLIGKTITVQYFSETKNQKGLLSLRFPVFKVFHGDKREV